MTVSDQIKTLERKIMQNKAQYDLDRKAANISALSSNDLGKCEYWTAEDLGLKPSTVEQARFENSPLGKVFTQGLREKDKKETLLRRLKNIEDKNDEQLKEIKEKKEVQTRLINTSKVKQLLLKNIHKQEVKDERSRKNI